MKLSAEQQLILAIEELAFGRKYVIREKKMTGEELGAAIYEMYFGPDNPRPGSPERNFRNYRKQFPAFGLDVAMDLQMAKISGFENNRDVIKKICRFYLNRFSIFYNDFPLERLIRTALDPGGIPYMLASINYGIRYRLPLDFTYHKMNSKKKDRRRVYPYAMTVRGDYLNVVAMDAADRRIKQFILSRITEFHTDIIDVFTRKEETAAPHLSPFDYDAYLQSEDGSFFRQKIRYTIELLAHSFDHFCHSYDFPYTVIEKKGTTKTVIELASVDFHGVYQMLFNYGQFCRLLGPEEAIQEYRQLLTDALAQVDSHSGKE